MQSGEETGGVDSPLTSSDTADAAAAAASSSGGGGGESKMGMLRLLVQAMYILISAAAVGMGSGLLISKLLKSLDTLKTSPVRQVAILMLGGYLSFRCASVLGGEGGGGVFSFLSLALGRLLIHRALLFET